MCPEIAIIEASLHDNGPLDPGNDKSYHKKAFMEATISIPTTINEESSRHNSLVPPIKPTPSPSIEAIYEETVVDSTCNSSDKDRNTIQMKMLSTSNENTSNPDAQSDECVKLECDALLTPGVSDDSECEVSH